VRVFFRKQQATLVSHSPALPLLNVSVRQRFAAVRTTNGSNFERQWLIFKERSTKFEDIAPRINQAIILTISRKLPAMSWHYSRSTRSHFRKFPIFPAGDRPPLRSK
jgi:hypothetical protein